MVFGEELGLNQWDFPLEGRGSYILYFLPEKTQKKSNFSTNDINNNFKFDLINRHLFLVPLEIKKKKEKEEDHKFLSISK